jgi:hypothetical protein
LTTAAAGVVLRDPLERADGVESVPLPFASRKRDEWTIARFAMPQAVPAMVPATWVPWPWPSSQPRKTIVEKQSGETRPARSLIGVTPVSFT